MPGRELPLLNDRRHLPTWAAVLFILIMVLPVLLMRFGHDDASAGMERLTLVSAQETWIRQHAGEPRAWLIPTDRGNPRLVKPPLVVLLNMLSWVGLDPETADPQDLVARARSVSIAMTLLMLLGVFWIGHTIGDQRHGLLAMAIAAAMIFVQREGRLASYDMHLTAWTTLSIAAAMSAIVPPKALHDDEPAPARSHRVVRLALAACSSAWGGCPRDPLPLRSRSFHAAWRSGFCRPDDSATYFG